MKTRGCSQEFLKHIVDCHRRPFGVACLLILTACPGAGAVESRGPAGMMSESPEDVSDHLVERRAGSINLSQQIASPRPSIAALVEADSLARRARREGDPELLIKAASIAMEAPELGKLRSRTRYPYEPVREQPTVRTTDYVADLLDEAEAIAGGEIDLLDAIDDLREEGSRGRVGGALTTRGELPSYGTDVFMIPFEGEVPAHLFLRTNQGKGRLSVFDEHLNLVCEESFEGSAPQCLFQPLRTAVFRVHVNSVSDELLVYDLITN